MAAPVPTLTPTVSHFPSPGWDTRNHFLAFAVLMIPECSPLPVEMLPFTSPSS